MAFLKTIIFFSLLITSSVNAANANWQIIPQESSLSFTAIQNNAPVTGHFKSFGGQVIFDPTQLPQSKGNIEIDMKSVETSFADLTTTLKSSDWLDVERYPKASFVTTTFRDTGNNTYEASGILTIRDKKAPLKVNFTLEEYTANKAKVKGEVILKRSALGIGQGAWANTSEIKDEVTVKFEITAKNTP